MGSIKIAVMLIRAIVLSLLLVIGHAYNAYKIVKLEGRTASTAPLAWRATEKGDVVRHMASNHHRRAFPIRLSGSDESNSAKDPLKIILAGAPASGKAISTESRYSFSK